MDTKAAFSTLAADQFGTNRTVDPNATKSERAYALMMHLTTLLSVHTGLVLFVPAIMWAVKRKESPFIDDHGKETVNFHFTLVIYTIIVVLSGFLTCSIGWWILGPALYLYTMVFAVIASIAAHNGEYYRYPACLRFIH